MHYFSIYVVAILHFISQAELAREFRQFEDNAANGVHTMPNGTRMVRNGDPMHRIVCKFFQDCDRNHEWPESDAISEDSTRSSNTWKNSQPAGDRFWPCLHLTPSANFHLYILPNNSVRLSNVTLDIGHPSVAALIKAYYDFALLRIHRASPELKNWCFQQLNAFIMELITNVIAPLRKDHAITDEPPDIHLWKLQTVVRHRLHNYFREAYVPPRKIHDIKQGVQRACHIPVETIIVYIDNETELAVDQLASDNLGAHSYAEKGCFKFFEQRSAHETNYFRDGIVDISSPHFRSADTLAFPDGTQLLVSEGELFKILVTFYRCTMLDILSARDPETRLCLANLFNENMQTFVVNLKNQSVTDGLDLMLAMVKNEPTLTWNVLTPEKNFEKDLPVSEIKQNSTGILNIDPASSIIEMSRGEINGSTNASSVNQLSSFPANNSIIDLEAVKFYIVLSVCIILGLVFYFVVFLGFFIAWLVYVSHITKLRQEQDKFYLLMKEYTDDRETTDPDETTELLNKLPISHK